MPTTPLDQATLAAIFGERKERSNIEEAARSAGHEIKLDRDEAHECRWSCTCGAGGTRHKPRDRRADLELHCYFVTGLTPPDPGPVGWDKSELTTRHDTEPDRELSEQSLIERQAITDATAERAIALIDRRLSSQ